MERVIVTPEAPGLGHMLGDLISANIAAHPDRAKLLDQMRGKVNIRARDAAVEVGMLFTGPQLSIGSPLADPDIEIACDSDTLLSLSNVRLRMGGPDLLTAEGRALVTKILSRQVQISGMFTHPRLMMQLQKLLSVS